MTAHRYPVFWPGVLLHTRLRLYLRCNYRYHHPVCSLCSHPGCTASALLYAWCSDGTASMGAVVAAMKQLSPDLSQSELLAHHNLDPALHINIHTFILNIHTFPSRSSPWPGMHHLLMCLPCILLSQLPCCATFPSSTCPVNGIPDPHVHT